VVSVFRRRRDRAPKPPAPEWVRVATAMHQPEAEMLASLLGELDIPVLVRRTVMDVPDMLAGGPRELLVPADRALEARALLDPLDAPEEGEGAGEAPPAP
jgi:hypothetical protein